jgi:ubiquinol-cytochrome c reductase iron-sulfur subunit
MKPDRIISIAFAVSTAASIGLVAVYVSGGQAQAEGALLGTALGGLGVGLAVWSVTLLPSREETEERAALSSSAADVEGAESDLHPSEITRRKALVRLMVGAGGTLAGALAIPALSLGPRPGQSLFKTAWTPGARLVNPEGVPLKPTDLTLDSVLTVYPEGHVGSADAQTLLIKVDPQDLDMPEDRVDWAPDGCIGYSKICTHAGCPVGLYRAQAHELLCPCHQSTFDVLRGCAVTFGPADRPLPQLPITVDEEGFLVALGDFPEPVGPGFWNMTGGGD